MNENFQKNDIISLHIVDMAESGEGIGKIDSLVFFVIYAVVGDYVNTVITKPTKNIIYAKALDIITASPHRVNSPCDVSKYCGGCTLLDLDYNEDNANNELITQKGDISYLISFKKSEIHK